MMDSASSEEPPRSDPSTPQERLLRGDSIRVWLLENAVEAGIVEAALKEAGIPAVLDSFHDSAYDGLFTFKRGWGRVMVLKEDAQRAIEVIGKALEKPDAK